MCYDHPPFYMECTGEGKRVYALECKIDSEVFTCPLTVPQNMLRGDLLRVDELELRHRNRYT